jgi:hypothetical protein
MNSIDDFFRDFTAGRVRGNLNLAASARPGEPILFRGLRGGCFRDPLLLFGASPA